MRYWREVSRRVRVVHRTSNLRVGSSNLSERATVKFPPRGGMGAPPPFEPNQRSAPSAADQFGPYLPRRFRNQMIVRMAGGRHLQHGGALTGCQPRQQDDLSAGKLECVVMHVRVFHIDLAEAGDLLPNASLAEQTERAVVGNIVFKCQLGAGKQAYGRVGIADGGKSASDRSGEIGADELVSNRAG